MCWVALDRGARLAELRGEADLAQRWQSGAEEVRAEISHAVSISVACSSSTNDTVSLDASNLLVPLVRFLPPDDERVRATVLAIADELNDHGLILRYRVDETDDGLHGEEGTFLICSFWLVSHCQRSVKPSAPASCVSSCSPMPRRFTSTPRSSTREAVAISATSRRPSLTLH